MPWWYGMLKYVYIVVEDIQMYTNWCKLCKESFFSKRKDLNLVASNKKGLCNRFTCSGPRTMRVYYIVQTEKYTYLHFKDISRCITCQLFTGHPFFKSSPSPIQIKLSQPIPVQIQSFVLSQFLFKSLSSIQLSFFLNYFPSKCTIYYFPYIHLQI